MRVDELHNYFQSLLPPKADKYKRMYAKAWKPPAGAADQGQINTGSSVQAQ